MIIVHFLSNKNARVSLLVCSCRYRCTSDSGHSRAWQQKAKAMRWLEFLEGPRFESSRQNLPEMTTFLKRYFSDTANASAPMIR